MTAMNRAIEALLANGGEKVPVEEATLSSRLVVVCASAAPAGPRGVGYKQGRCDCGDFVWISPMSQQVIALRAEAALGEPKLMCCACALATAPGGFDA